MNKQIVVYPYDGLLLNNKEEKSTVTHQGFYKTLLSVK